MKYFQTVVLSTLTVCNAHLPVSRHRELHNYCEIFYSTHVQFSSEPNYLSVNLGHEVKIKGLQQIHKKYLQNLQRNQR